MRLTEAPPAQPDNRPAAAAALPRRPINPQAVVLLRLAQAGDRDAFGQLYTSFTPPVRAYITARTADRDVVADLLQETFLGALENLYLAHDDVHGWLLQMAARMCVRHAWSHRRYVRAALTAGEYHWSLAASGPASATAVDQRLVAAALAGLDPNERRTVQLRFLDGHAQELTARIMGCSRHTVRRIEQRALRHLGASLTDATAHHPAPGRTAR